MQPTKYFLILTLSLSSGCAMFGERVAVKQENVYLKVVCPDPAKPAAITTLKVRPQVIEDKIGIYWVGLTGKDYENLAVNVQETMRYIKDVHGVRDYYRACITDFNRQVEELEQKEAAAPDD